jgi:hypothetical protein
MSIWSNKEWHYQVRERLGETLAFYRVQIHHFDKERVCTSLRQLFETEKVQSARVYLIFGSYDLLIRVWMPPAIIPGFKFKLSEALGTDRTPQSFSVIRVARKSYADGSEEPVLDLKLLDGLFDMHRIRDVQEGKNPELLDALLKGNIVLRRESGGESTIVFFVALSLPAMTVPMHRTVRQAVDRHLQEMLSVRRPALYEGEGFSTFLIKGEVICSYYYNIVQLVEWLHETLRPHGLQTETYLSASREPILHGEEKIDDRTFIEKREKVPIVEAIIPEVYRELSSGSDDMIRFIANQFRGKEIGPEDRRLFRDYFLGCFQRSVTKASVPLLVFFTELEAYLEKMHSTFAGRIELEPKVVYQAAKIDTGRPSTMQPLLAFYGHALRLANIPGTEDLQGGWNDFIALRNKPAHGRLSLDEWKPPVGVLLDNLPRVRRLVEVIREKTGESPSFTY